MKKLVSDSKEVMGRYDSRTRAGMIKMMDDALASLPEDQRKTAEFEIDVYNHDYDPNDYYALFVKFKRLETDAEETKREAQEALYAAQRLAAERKEYERLKKQFA